MTPEKTLQMMDAYFERNGLEELTELEARLLHCLGVPQMRPGAGGNMRTRFEERRAAWREAVGPTVAEDHAQRLESTVREHRAPVLRSAEEWAEEMEPSR